MSNGDFSSRLQNLVGELMSLETEATRLGEQYVAHNLWWARSFVVAAAQRVEPPIGALQVLTHGPGGDGAARAIANRLFPPPVGDAGFQVARPVPPEFDTGARRLLEERQQEWRTLGIPENLIRMASTQAVSGAIGFARRMERFGVVNRRAVMEYYINEVADPWVRAMGQAARGF